MEPKANVDLMGNNQQTKGMLANEMLSRGSLNMRAMKPWIPKLNNPDDYYMQGLSQPGYITIYKGGNPKLKTSYVNRPVANATLRRDEWISLDEAILEISRTRLNGIQDLIDKNLTFNLGNAMGTTVLEHHTVSDSMEADLSMTGETRSPGDRPNFETLYTPIPIIHVDYSISRRTLEASRKLGNPLDVTSADQAARKVAEKLESMLFTSTSYVFGGGTIWSYLNHPNRNTRTLGTAWTTKTAAQIVDQVIAGKQDEIDAKHYGPYALYIPTAYETVLDKDYDTTTPGKTIRQRILEINNIDSVKVVDTLTADNVLLVQMTSDVVRLIRGLGIQSMEWRTEPFIVKHKVITIQVPQIRADQDGNSGVLHISN